MNGVCVCVSVRCFSKKVKITTSIKIATCNKRQRHFNSAPSQKHFNFKAHRISSCAQQPIYSPFGLINGITMFPRAYGINHVSAKARLLASLMIETVESVMCIVKCLKCVTVCSNCVCYKYIAQDLFHLK